MHSAELYKNERDLINCQNVARVDDFDNGAEMLVELFLFEQEIA